MVARHIHSKEFKDSIVEKILNRGERTISSVCEETGILQGTATKWLRVYGKVGIQQKPRGSMKWSAEAKLKAIVDTTSLSENDLGIYLRREGLYSNQVTEWRAEIIKNFRMRSKFKKDARDEKIKILERDLLRKDKALAEASALLILQKKVDLIWGNKSEGER